MPPSSDGTPSRLKAREDAAHDAVRATLASDEFTATARLAASAGLDEGEGERLLAHVASHSAARERIAAVKRAIANDPPPSPDTALERLLILRAVARSIGRVSALPVSDAVKTLFYEEFMLYARPDARRAPLLAIGQGGFTAACEVATLRRFPAGQLHWNLSGLPRRMLLDVPPPLIPRTLAFVAWRMHGFAPAFFSHVNGLRRNRFVWLEEESNRSYYRMATSLDAQPRTLGLVTRSWFHDPELAATSPHLAWTNRVILENGGFVVRAGEAGPDEGFLSNNEARRRAYETGQYRPHLGLVLWPRDEMMAWARRNPGLADSL